jgi:nitrous oxidase accessory protein NosD
MCSATDNADTTVGLFSALLLVGVLWAFPAEAATTWYVSRQGNDANPGTEQQPFKTFQKGIRSAQAGDTVQLRAGTYDLAARPVVIDQPLTLIGEGKRATVLTNGPTLTFTNSLTLKDLVFRGGPVLVPSPPEGKTLDGIVIGNCLFEKSWGGLQGRDYKGQISNVQITNCEFSDLSGGKVTAIGVFRGLVSHVKITGNTFKNLSSEGRACNAVLIGDVHTTTDVLISDNLMDTIRGPVTAGSSGQEVHGILAFGTNIQILRNTVKNLNGGTDHEAIYMKARDSIIADNVVEGAGSGAGGADICIKGAQFSNNNIVRGNRISSDQAGSGIFIAGGVVVKDNQVKKPNGWAGIDVYPMGKPVTITANRIETRLGAGIYVNGGDESGRAFAWADPGEVVVTENVTRSYEGWPIKMENVQRARVTGNEEHKGRE